MLGALGAAVPAWAWNSSRSVAGGNLETVPPENVWDAAADPVVRRLFEEEGITRIEELNALLRPWHRNDQPLPAGPAGRPRRLHRGGAGRSRRGSTGPSSPTRFDFYELRGIYTGLLYGLGSGIMSCAIPDEARAVYHSKGGEDMRDRVAKTAKLGYDIGTENAFDPDGEMIVTCIKTRLTHSAVRYLITSSPRWQAGGDIPAPISQRDLMITWHSLATFIHRTLGEWNVAADRRPTPTGFLHVWQVTAHYLGVEDVYIPATWADAQYQSDQTLDPVIGADARGHRAGRDPAVARRRVRPGPQPRRRSTRWPATWSARTTPARASPTCSRSRRTRSGTEASRTAGRRSSPSASRAPGSPAANRLYWTFDELLRLGVLWGINGGPGPIYIEMPTANRSEESYPDPY